MKEKLNEFIIKLLLDKSDYINASLIANQINVNEKTIRRRIEYLKSVIPKDLAIIQSRRGKGYIIKVFNQIEFNRFYDYSIAETEINNPVNRRTLIYQMLAESKFVNKQEILNRFFISEATLHMDIHQLNEIGKDNQFKITYVNRKGFNLTGDTYHIRNTLLRLNFDSGFVGVLRRRSVEIKKPIIEALKLVFKDEGYYVNKHSIDAIFNFVSISSTMILRGRTLELPNTFKIDELDFNLINLAKKIHSRIAVLNKVEFSYDETLFLAYFLRSSVPPEILNKNIEDNSNDRLYQLLNLTLEILYEFGFYDSERLTLKEDLFKFYQGLNARIKLNIQKRLKFYKNIQTTYPMAFNFARTIIIQLQNSLKIEFSDEEVAYLSLIFHYHLFSNIGKQKRTLVVLPSDYTVARLFIRELSKFENAQIDFYEFSEVNDSLLNNGLYNYLVLPFDYDFNVKSLNVLKVSEVLSAEEQNYLNQTFLYNNIDLLRRNLSSIREIEKKSNLEIKSILSNLLEIKVKNSLISFNISQLHSPIHIQIYTINSEKLILIHINKSLNFHEKIDLYRASHTIIDLFYEDKDTFNISKIKKLFYI